MAMEFGRDRLPEAERWCSAWPEHPDSARKAAYTRWVKGASDDPRIRQHFCQECCGPLTVKATGNRAARTADNVGVPDVWAHESGRYVGGKFQSACLAWLTAHPENARQHGPEITEAPAPERASRPEPCPRCGRSDFRTANGREWHVANAPDCRRYVNREKHEYREVAA